MQQMWNLMESLEFIVLINNVEIPCSNYREIERKNKCNDNNYYNRLKYECFDIYGVYLTMWSCNTIYNDVMLFIAM